MARAKGIGAYPYLKLGKSPARKDARNFKFAALLRAKPKVPAEYDFDTTHPAVPTPMFGNDEYGDCVIAGRAHQTLRFELVEQKKILPIKESEVVGEYLDQTDGEDDGLVVLDSLRDWRRDGWKVGRRRYRIKAFSQIDQKNRAEVKQAIFLDLGVGIGLDLPRSAQRQMQSGRPWDVVTGKDAKPGSWGGHYVYVSGYTRTGPVCVTWGQKKQMTWAFLGKYCDEAYAIIDAINTKKKQAALDVKSLDAMLKAL